jgi:hypothetical protein
MDEGCGRDRSSGPFLMPAPGDGRDAGSFAAYCRLPNGRIRVPEPDQLLFLCLDGHCPDCLGYSRWHPTEGETAPAGR